MPDECILSVNWHILLWRNLTQIGCKRYNFTFGYFGVSASQKGQINKLYEIP